MAVSQTKFRSFVQIPVITLCVLGLVGCGGSDDGCNPIIAGTMPYLCFLPSTTPNVPTSTIPNTPSARYAKVESAGIIVISWRQAGVHKYQVYRDGVKHATVRHSGLPGSPSGVVWRDKSVDPNSRYCYQVTALDASGNESYRSNWVCATTPEDLTAPTTPDHVKAVSVSTQNSEISLSWGKASDYYRVAGYKIHRDGILIQDVIELQFSDTGLNRNTTYCYTVSAYDPSLNESAHSDPACTTTSWAMTELDSAAPQALVSLVVDTSDQVHIAYSTWYTDSRVSIRELLYVTNRGGFWETESIESSGGKPTIAVDPSGAVHVGLQSRYFTNLSGEWFSEIINPGNPINIYSLALDSIGNVHIGYKNLPNTGEFGIFNATNGGGVWTYEQTVGEAPAYGPIAIAMDAFDALHIAYYHALSKELRYMTNATGTWTGDVVESNIQIIFNIGLAVDDSSRAHLSYYGTTNRDLKYASNASGAWVIEIPDSQDDVGSGASIAVDADGKVHISYTDQTYQNLKYVSNASDTWNPVVIDSAEVTGNGWTAGSTSIAVDSIGKVHISYYGIESVWYATNR